MIKKNVTIKDKPPSMKIVEERKFGKVRCQLFIAAEKRNSNVEIAMDTFNVFLLII